MKTRFNSDSLQNNAKDFLVSSCAKCLVTGLNSTSISSTRRGKCFCWLTTPFRWFFTRIELKTPEGKPLGAIEKRFSILTKRFDVENSKGLVIFEVASPIWKIWNFAFKHKGRDVPSVNKKWSGLLSEAFTDRDNFMVEFLHADLTDEERQLVMASAVFIDLLYFERKQ